MLLFVSCDNKSPEPEPELEPCEIYATGIYNNTFPGEVPHKYWPCMNTKDLVDAVSYNLTAVISLWPDVVVYRAVTIFVKATIPDMRNWNQETMHSSGFWQSTFPSIRLNMI